MGSVMGSEIGDDGGSSGDSGNGDGSSGMVGISRGGGYTPLTYGDKASDHNVKYKDELLPDVNKESAMDSTSIGIGIAAPTVDNDKSDYSAKDFDTRNKVGNNTNDKNLLPKYRNTVKNYFNR